MQKSLHKLLLPIVCLLVLNLDAQILAPFANYADTVNSSVSDGPDSLFIFNFDNDSTFIIADTQNYSGYTFQWKIYDLLNGYVNHSVGERVDFIPDSIAIGFRLIYSNGGTTDSINCWVVKNDFNMKITSKDFGDTLWTSSYLYCDRLELIDVNLGRAHLEYYNPETLDTLFYEIGYKSEWIKEQDITEGNVFVVTSYGDIIRHRIVDPYWDGMWYTNIHTDSAGIEIRDSMYVRSMVPKGEFTSNFIRLDDPDFFPDRSDAYYDAYGDEYHSNLAGEGTAPATYHFDAGESKNTHDYVWFFGDTSKAKTTIADSVVHVYHYWGTFKPKMVARHNFELINKICTDTVEISDDLIIAKPQLQAPNAFSPPSGDNPYWRFRDITITDFEITIFNRNGLKVHTFKGNIRNWDGWDGSYRNSTNTVPTGVYFYVVKKIGVPPNIVATESQPAEWLGGGDNTEYKGFIHVFNTEQQ